jgi:hypothetical protein
MLVKIQWLVLMTFAAACGGSEAATTDSQANGSTANSAGDAALPACANLDSNDASYESCGAARAFVSCTAPNGGGMGCLSNDPTQCPGPAAVTPGCSSTTGCASTWTCVDVCHADEFAVSCGAIGPQAGPAVPSTCRVTAPTPGGVVFACCPCD